MSQDTSLDLDALLRQVASAPDATLPYPASWLRLGPGCNLGSYRIVARLGTGGMGVVFHAVDERLQRPVALKLLRKTEDRDLRTRREARSAASVVHPNVATVYEADEIDGIPFLAMELIDGATLRQWSKQPRAYGQQVEVARQLIKAVVGLHEASLIHRDLKPDNVMVSDRGGVKLLDFGLATRCGENDDGASSGTAPYMAPEQQAGSPITAAADVFALGVVLEEFAGPKMQRKLRKIVRRCREKAPGDRFNDAGELLLQFEKVFSPRRAPVALAAVFFALATSVVTYAAFQRSPATAPLKPHTQVSARFSAKRINSVLISPDGQKIAYSDGKTLLVYDGATQRSTRRAAPAETKVAAVGWSQAAEVLVYAERPSDDFAIEVFKATQDSWRSLHPPIRADSFDIDPALKKVAWVRDGTLYFGSVGSPESTGQLKLPSGDSVGHLRWSPDGSKLAFMSYHGAQRGTGVSLQVFDSGEIKTLVADNRLAQGHGAGTFTWLDNDVVLYALAEPGSEPGVSLWRRSVGSGGESEHQTTWNGRVIGQLSASAGKLAYLRFTSQEDIWVGPLTNDGQKLERPRRVTHTEFNERLSAWSRDGQSLLYMSNENGRIEAYRHSLEGSAREVIVEDLERSTWPVESRTGTFVWRHEADNVVLHHLDGKGVSQGRLHEAPDAWTGVGRPPPRHLAVRCARVSGRCVLAEKLSGTLLFRGIDTKGQIVELGSVVHRGPNAYAWALSPSGDRVAVIDEARRLSVVQLDAMATTHYALPPDITFQAVVWACDATSFFLTGYSGGDLPFPLVHFDLDGSYSTVYETAGTWMIQPQVSPDCSQLAFTGHDLDTDVWFTSL